LLVRLAAIKVTADSAKSVILNISGSKESVSAPELEAFKGVWNYACGEEAFSLR
jgi:hypothetical protein